MYIYIPCIEPKNKNMRQISLVISRSRGEKSGEGLVLLLHHGLEKNREKAWYYYYIMGYHPQGGSEPGLNSLDNFYIPTSNLAICFFFLEDSSPSAETFLTRSEALALRLLLSSVDVHA